MAQISGQCQDCGSEVIIYTNQNIWDRQLVWWAEYACQHCGFEIHLDDGGYPPEEIRQAILAEQGKWRLAIAETGRGRILATKILRQVMDLSLAEAMKLKNMMPGTIAFGTKVEIERLRIILASEGLAVEAIQYF